MGDFRAAQVLRATLAGVMRGPPPSVEEIRARTPGEREHAERWAARELAIRRGFSDRPLKIPNWLAAPKPPGPALMPVCAVREVVEAAGPRGGTIHVLTLACGAWATRHRVGGRKRPPAAIPCVSCFLRQRQQQQGEDA